MSNNSPAAERIPLTTTSHDTSAGDPNAERNNTDKTSSRSIPPLRLIRSRYTYTYAALFALFAQNGSLFTSLANPSLSSAVHCTLLLASPFTASAFLIILAKLLLHQKKALKLNPVTAFLLPTSLAMTGILGAVAMRNPVRVAHALKLAKPFDTLALQLYGAAFLGVVGLAEGMGLWYSMGRWAGIVQGWSEVEEVLERAVGMGPGLSNAIAEGAGTTVDPAQSAGPPLPATPTTRCKIELPPPPPYFSSSTSTLSLPTYTNRIPSTPSQQH